MVTASFIGGGGEGVSTGENYRPAQITDKFSHIFGYSTPLHGLESKLKIEQH